LQDEFEEAEQEAKEHEPNVRMIQEPESSSEMGIETSVRKRGKREGARGVEIEGIKS
jgi:hypothetical protein